MFLKPKPGNGKKPDKSLQGNKILKVFYRSILKILRTYDRG